MTLDPRPVPEDVGPPTDAPDDGAAPGAVPAVPFAEVRRRAVQAIAHAIRTPLSLVAAPLELVDAATELGDRERRHLAVARDNVARVRDELERLVEVARWPTQVVPTTTDLATLVGAVLPPLQSRLHDRTVTVDLPVTTDCLVDRATTGWALRVLVEDMAADSGPGGRVQVATLRSDDDGGVVVVVRNRDEAQGPAEGLVDTARPLVAAARDVVTTQGGTVTLEPDTIELRFRSAGPATDVAIAPDAGAAIHPTTSASQPEAAPDPEPPAGAGAGDRPVVLMVEDDEQLRALLEAALADDYRIVSAATAEAAFARVREVEPDLVVCDVVLPGANGEEFVEALQHHPALADVPVVILTGRTDEDLRVRLLRSGADDYLTKPFVVAELRARIANLADRRRDTTALHGRLDEARRLSDQLQVALDSRVVIEQAKAFVAAERRIDVDEAFGILRRWARAHGVRLHDVARAVVDTDFRP